MVCCVVWNLSNNDITVWANLNLDLELNSNSFMARVRRCWNFEFGLGFNFFMSLKPGFQYGIDLGLKIMISASCSIVKMSEHYVTSGHNRI